jgi:Zn-dependent protease with chaperone function
MLLFFHLPLLSTAMPKKYRVVSQAAPVAGKTRQDVVKALLKVNMKPEQIELVLNKPLVIKKGLDNPQALEYAERFSAAGLRVKIEAYDVAPPQEVADANKQKEQVYNQLLQTFSQPVQPTQVTGDYKRTLTRVLLAAMAAPLLYAGIVLLTASFLLWYFGSLHGAVFEGIEWRGKVMWALWALTYLLPAVVGGVLLVFLLYPLWPRGKRPRPHVLDPKKYARFYHLVNQMTAAMEVPAPEFIEITPEVNAAAGPVHGMFSLAKGELRLVIGLSLVSGMTVQQFMGVLAHEFGHFSQRSSMIANIWVNTINGWLAECAYGQDEWDERFARWHEQYDLEVVQISLLAAEWMVGLVRRLFAHLCNLNL